MKRHVVAYENRPSLLIAVWLYSEDNLHVIVLFIFKKQLFQHKVGQVSFVDTEDTS